MKQVGRYLKDLWKRKSLLVYLVTSGLKADTRNTILGYFWWLLDPALFVMVFAFVRVVLMGRAGENFVAFLAVGLLAFQFFAQTLTGSARSISGKAGIITQVYLPKSIFPVSVVLTQLINFLFALVTVGIILAASQIVPGPEVAWLPVIILAQLSFHVVIALIMAYVAVFVRDLQRILGHVTRIIRFTSPVLFEVELVPEELQFFIDYNPFSWLVIAYREVLMYGRVPNMARLGWLAVACVSISILLIVFYAYREHRAVKVL